MAVKTDTQLFSDDLTKMYIYSLGRITIWELLFWNSILIYLLTVLYLIEFTIT